MEQIATLLFQLIFCWIAIFSFFIILHVRSDDYFLELLRDSTYTYEQIKKTQNGTIFFFVLLLAAAVFTLIFV
jgi:hypothetical protein